MNRWLLVGVLLWSVTARADWGAEAATPVPAVEWDLLGLLNYETGQFPPELAALNGERVRVPGFVVPLGMDNPDTLQEFLLVPGYGYCIHVPPPPPNQMVYVNLGKEVPLQDLLPDGSIWIPVWVTGRLQIATADSEYGAVGFTLIGEAVTVYEFEE